MKDDGGCYDELMKYVWLHFMSGYLTPSHTALFCWARAHFDVAFSLVCLQGYLTSSYAAIFVEQGNFLKLFGGHIACRCNYWFLHVLSFCVCVWACLVVTLPARAFNSFLHSPFVLPLKGSHLSEGVYIYVFPLLTSTGSMQTLRSNWALHFYLIFFVGMGGGG